jgi:hypothetical protein
MDSPCCGIDAADAQRTLLASPAYPAIHDDDVVRDGGTVLVADTNPADEVQYQVLWHYRTSDLGPAAV